MTSCGGPAPAPTGDTYLTEWNRRLPEYLAAASESQRQALEDGVVTASEYEKAYLAYVGCIEAGGVTILSMERDKDGLIESMAVRGPTPDDDASAIVEECNREEYFYILLGWRTALSPDDSDALLLRRVAECLQLRGYQVPDEPADMVEISTAVNSDDAGAREAIVACADEAQ